MMPASRVQRVPTWLHHGVAAASAHIQEHGYIDSLNKSAMKNQLGTTTQKTKTYFAIHWRRQPSFAP